GRSKTSSKSIAPPTPFLPVIAMFVDSSFVLPPRSIQTRSGILLANSSARADVATTPRTMTEREAIFRKLMMGPPLGDGNFGAEIDVLDRVEELDPLGHRPLERLAARDEAGAAGALVDDRRRDRLGEIVRAGGSAGVDEAGASHISVRHLVAAEVDRVV